MRIVLVFIFSFFAFCSGIEESKSIALSNGNFEKIFYYFENESEGENKMVVTYRTEESNLRIETVESDVDLIFEAIKLEAEKNDIQEILVNFEHPSGFDKQAGKPVYDVIITEASRGEDGKWSLIKVNY